MTYDVVICGGGFAGQTLARQLKIKDDKLSILVIEKAKFPLPEAAHKVGESMVDISGYYLNTTLELEDYFKNNHYVKMGLRFFFGDPSGPFYQRPELGLSRFAPHDSYQLDRGKFENDLYHLNQVDQVEFRTGSLVRDIRLGEQDEPHEVDVLDRDSGEKMTVKAKWLIDATGRARMLQNKLGLNMKATSNYCSAWFRIAGRLDVEDLVPVEESDWHNRVPHRNRYYSTNHIMGTGYWIWIIPLKTGHTSIGIVTNDEVHPFSTYNSKEKAIQWLATHEPSIHLLVGAKAFLDFKMLRKYSLHSKQIFSGQRWACTGEAAIFPDPFYSIGGNLIAFENTIITHLIDKYQDETPDPSEVNYFNQFLLFQNNWLTKTIQSSYAYFGCGQVMSLSYLWELTLGWVIAVPQFFNKTIFDPELRNRINSITRDLFPLILKVQQLFQDWIKMKQERFSFQFIDYYYGIPFIKTLYDRNLKSGKSDDELVADHIFSMQKMKEFAIAIFLLVIEDTQPEYLSQLGSGVNLNPMGIGYYPEKWEQEGLFESPAPDMNPAEVHQQLRGLFTFENLRVESG